MDFTEKYNEYLDKINSYIAKWTQPDNFTGRESDGFYTILEAMTYSLTNGGKRIRPVLTLEFCNACGGNVEDALGFALAVEMIHTYSLIHDDLPCMDDDDMRRGKPSNHIIYGYPNALLAGDALLTLAFEVISMQSLPAEKKIKAVYELSRASGCTGMIAGQVMDLGNEEKYISADDLTLTDSLKTGRMIEAACVLGCIAAGADEEKIEAARIYAGKLGLAFQIVDDMLDVIGNEEILGKPVGSDEQNSKSTYASTLGIDECRRLASKLTDEAIFALEPLGENADFLKELAVNLLNRDN